MSGMTDAQEHQTDVIHNAAYEAIEKVLEPFGIDPEWSMEWIGELSDSIADIAKRYFGLTEMQVYPYIDDEDDPGPAEPTTRYFWDCDCEKNYIHSRIQEYCPACQSISCDHPNSTVSEVIKFLAAGE